jgi:hypothetical protein
MATLPGGKVPRAIPDKKSPASPMNDSGRNPQASPRPENSEAYSAAKPQANNYAAREAELKKHHQDLRTDASTGKRY